MSTRLFVSEALGNGRELVLVGDRARYLGRVLRLATGDEIRVFNGDDGEWSARVSAFGKDRVTIVLGAAIPNDAESHLRMHLVQGVSRGDRMDFVVQKATELGIKRITPVLAAHGVVKLDGRRATNRREHWQRVAESACEQCGRIRPPLIDPPIELNAWLGTGTSRDSTQLILAPGARTPLQAVDTVAEKLCLLIGPEGGFSERECEDAAVAGFTPVSLGPRVMRTETAAVAALAVAQSLWGDLANTPESLRPGS
jgi:16S rRNA (uracil1498-N3)-methyltransferase